jgi:hypothetical protein
MNFAPLKSLNAPLTDFDLVRGTLPPFGGGDCLEATVSPKIGENDADLSITAGA